MVGINKWIINKFLWKSVMIQLRQIAIRIHILKNAIIPNIEGLLCDKHSVYAFYLLPDLILTVTLWH